MIFVLVSAFSCYAHDDFPTRPLFHFDATDSKSLDLDPANVVRSWKSQTNDTKLINSSHTENFVEYHEDAINDQPGIRFNGEKGFLTLETKTRPEVRMGSFHLFAVAKVMPNVEEQFIIGMGEDYPKFTLFSNGQNYRLKTGDGQYQQRTGPVIDSNVHLFEFSHVIEEELQKITGRRIWPGDFYVDGSLCGKLFNEEIELPIDLLTVGANNKGKTGFLDGTIAEIILFNKPLSGEQIESIRHHLARKWDISLNEWEVPDDLPILKETRVGPPGKHSSFGYFGESPESPDGSRIAYIAFDEPINQDNPREYFSLWVCDVDLGNQRKVLNSPFQTNLHNGAVQHWVDNSRIVLGSHRGGEIIVVNVDSGEIEFGPYSPGWPGGIGFGGKVLLHMSGESDLGPIGLYQLDVKTGDKKRLFAAEDFVDWHTKYNWHGSNDPNTWRFVHGKFSENGSHIGAAVVTSGAGGGQHVFTARTDGTDLRIWGNLTPDTGADKPLHWQWYDDELIYGVDQDNYDGTPNNLFIKIWDRNGNYIETIAGKGNHLGMSYDKKWIVAETFYYEDPVKLYLYRHGKTEPVSVIFEHDGIMPTWVYGGHVNPAFSRDSKRVYYNRPVDNELVQAYFVDISHNPL